MLDHLTGGRLEIGCASGVPQSYTNRYRTRGEPRTLRRDPADPGRIVAEPVISHHGRYYNFDSLRVVPRPAQQPSPPNGNAAARLRNQACRTTIPECTALNPLHASRRFRCLSAGGRPARICRWGGPPRHPPQRFDRRERNGGKRTIPERKRGDSQGAGGRPTRASAVVFAAGRPQARQRFLRACGRVHRRDSGPGGRADHRAMRQVGAGHILAILGRAVDEHRLRAVELFAEQVIPILRRADVNYRLSISGHSALADLFRPFL